MRFYIDRTRGASVWQTACCLLRPLVFSEPPNDRDVMCEIGEEQLFSVSAHLNTSMHTLLPDSEREQDWKVSLGVITLAVRMKDDRENGSRIRRFLRYDMQTSSPNSGRGQEWRTSLGVSTLPVRMRDDHETGSRIRRGLRYGGLNLQRAEVISNFRN